MGFADGLRDQVLGQVIEPGEPEYEQARRIHNGMIDRRPAAIVRATGAADVITTVRAAHDAGVALAIRCGGHSLPGLSTCDDGILLDLSRIRGVCVDPAARTAQVGGGTLLRELDHETMAFGLATTTGTVSSTGVGGLTLGGGMGRLHRLLGLSLDNLRSVDLVTADGRLVTASEDEEPDLFWAVRGAGANFGVVTRFEFSLHPLMPIAYAGLAVHPIERARDALAAYRAFALDAPDEVVTLVSIGTLGPGGPFPPKLHGRRAVVLAVSVVNKAPEEAERITMGLRSHGTPLFQFGMPAPYVAFQRVLDARFVAGRRYYVKGITADELSDDAIDTIIAATAETPGDGAEFSLIALGGAISRVPEDATAYSGRHAAFHLSAEVTWDDPAQDDASLAWGRATMAAVQRFAGVGNYVNALDTGGEEAARVAYGEEKFKRLSELKGVWDPDNVFRLNQNIPPRRSAPTPYSMPSSTR